MNRLKICAYVVGAHAKQNYKSESFNTRLFAGLSVVIDILKRKGYQIDFASKATVHNYDVVLVSITSDCDWWPFIAERVKWQKGNYKVVAGGAGVLNVRPFLELVDYFVLGRAEGAADGLVDAIATNTPFEHKSIINGKTFDCNNFYYLNQVEHYYPHEIILENGKAYKENNLGCNHKCLFCGYTWHRKNISKEFEWDWIWAGSQDRERAILDIAKGKDIDFNKLRTTAIDGFSQRLRFMVNKKITRDMLQDFIYKLAKCEKPHQVKFYNIVGYPTETPDDWQEFLEDIIAVDKKLPKTDKQTSVLLHSTPFRAMPATPLACKEMSYKNYRGEIARVLGGGKYKGNIFYQGNSIWAVESMATESLSTVIQSAIVWRGTEKDTENMIKISCSNKFSAASTTVKQATLEKYFDVKTLFGKFTAETLPTKYLKTYANIEKMW
jgi:radical SAM superfamily enzyme YgiQ (UPF0313 family)